MNPFKRLLIRAIVGAGLAAILTRVYYGSIDPFYIAGLAIILVGLAYFAEYLRNRKSR